MQYNTRTVRKYSKLKFISTFSPWMPVPGSPTCPAGPGGPTSPYLETHITIFTHFKWEVGKLKIM